MTDDLELRIRESLGRGPAGGSGHASRPRPAAVRRAGAGAAGSAPPLVAAGVALVVLALGAGLLATGAVGPASTAPRWPATSPLPRTHRHVPRRARSLHRGSASTSPRDGATRRRLESPSIPGYRYVGLLARGMRFCHTVMYSTAPPTPTPTACSVQADQPGTAVLFITEFTHQYPWPPQSDLPPVADSPYPAWGPPTESTSPSWFVQAPDGGIYFMRLDAPPGELDTRAAEITSMLTSLRLSAGRWRLRSSTVGSVETSAVSRSTTRLAGPSTTRRTSRRWTRPS